MKRTGKGFRTVALAMMLLVVMVAGTACSVSFGSPSGGSGIFGKKKAPTVFDQPKKEYEGFETLKEVTMDGEGDMEKIKLYVPKDSATSSGDYAGGYADGGLDVFIMKADSSLITICNGDVKKMVEKFGDFRYADNNATEEKVSTIKTAHDGDIAYQTNLFTRKNYKGEYVTECRTTAAIRLDDKNMFQMDITVKADTPNAEKIIEELSAYYGFDIYFDAAKAKERQEYFSKNPQTTTTGGTVAEMDGFSFQIPENYKKVAGKDSDTVDCYCPNGTISMTENFFLVTNSHGIQNVKNLPKDQLRETIKKTLSTQMTEATISLTDAESPLPDAITYKIEIDTKGVKEVGYVLICDNTLAMIFVAGDGSVSQSQLDVLDAALKSAKKR